jgi:predicted histone-like DNA-binding protein
LRNKIQNIALYLYHTKAPTHFIMAIHYRIVRRKNIQDTAETQYIMQHISSGIVDLEQLSDEISKESAFSAADVLGVATALAGRLQHHLNKGNIVEIGPLGRFKIGFRAKPLPGPTPNHNPKAESFHINFQPGARLKRWLKNGLDLKLER